MQTIKNLVNSPYNIQCKDGSKVRLPARGEITVEIDPLHLPLYRALQYFHIVEHEDGDTDDALKEMRELYQTVTGKKAYYGWSIEELQEKIANNG